MTHRLLAPILFSLALVFLGLGLYRAGARAGASACEATWQARAVEEIATRQRLLNAAQATADALTRQLAARETQTRIVYKEVIRAIPAATAGRACLGADAIGLLDRYQAAAAGFALPTPTGQPLDPAGSAATDTQVAQWALDAIEQHERERARCNALIAWHAEQEQTP